MSPLVVLLLVAPSLAVADLMPQPHDGLYLKPLPRVLAYSAQLVIIPFDTAIPNLTASLDRLTTFLEEKLNEMSPNQTHVTGPVINDLRKMHARLNLHLKDVSWTARRNAHRKKRSFSFSPLSSLSSLLGFCCGFMTAEDKRGLEARDEAVWDHMIEKEDRTDNALYQIQEHERKLAKELNEWKAYVEENHHDLKQHVTKLMGHASQVDMTAALINALAFDVMLVADRIRSIEAACVAGRIPSTVVTQKDLEDIVKRVNQRNPRHRVAVNDADTLYKLEMASCQFSARTEELKVMAWFPLEPINESSAGWKTYDVIPMEFLYEDEVCQLLEHPVVAIVAESAESSKTVVRLMEGEQRTECLSRAVCNVPRVTAAEDMACINGVLTGAETEELKSVCSFTCRPYRRLQIVHTGHNNYAVVNADRDLEVRCPGGEAHDVPPRTEGAHLLEVPCDCTLEDKDEGAVLIEPQEPCDKGYSTAINVTPIVPKLWVVDDYARLTFNMTEVPTEELKSRFLNFSKPPSLGMSPSGDRVPFPSSGGFWGAVEQWLPIALLHLPSIVMLVIIFRRLQGLDRRVHKLGA